MGSDKKVEIDPNKVVTRPDGKKVRPGRFTSGGEGMTITEPGETPPKDDEDEADGE